MTKILLVDDDPASSNLLKMFLEFEAFEVISVYTLEKAREALDKSIRLVLLDYHLSRNVSGLVLLDEIRAEQTGSDRNIPVVITSGDDRVSQSVLEQGASAFMHKPFSPSALVEKIRELL
ncbi:MAG: DNA-binding response OmpR family regulator [Cellvibrionaceae bacterium]|jgi:DNA-binding response OmpR family regulator